METKETKLSDKIKEALKAFQYGSLRDKAVFLLGTLGYTSDKTLDLEGSPAAFLGQFGRNEQTFNRKKALFDDWKSIDFLFQLTDDELSRQTPLFQDNKVNPGLMQSYLFFAVELSGDKYSRRELADIARQINRLFPSPVMVLIKHLSEKQPVLSIAVINRRQNKIDANKDVLGKVTIIRNISLVEPHRGHLDILHSFALVNLTHPQHIPITSFDTLHAAWENILNVKLLNDRFYKEIRNWFYWARLNAKFPSGTAKDVEDRDSEALIRLLTRLIFCWFIKEKRFIPEDLFSSTSVRTLLINWSPSDQDTGGRYYLAILQNLFFATLATPSNERRFREARSYQGKNKHYGDQRYFRHVKLFQEKAPVEDLYKQIPFLNGGLFENLDEFPSEDNALKEENRVDGFSDTPSKQPCVPDFLFFGDSREIAELSAILGEKNQNTRGLLNIFCDYKFTIEENTPLEEEIALDPELLGRVFENLLAAVNPETGATVRKSTGSFYTPREIVDYMSAESLTRWLLTNLSPDIHDQDLEEKLRELVSYESPAHTFTPAQTRLMTDALGRLRIFDPACGSGAFPMGLLHLLVHVLKKLDPENEQWKETKLAALPPEMREKAEDAFRHESFDYTRKLELVRDCIHGCDIQPAAIQITKLRFFLSLVIEQHEVSPRPLPNLEIKFVCANSLLGIPRPKGYDLFQFQIEPQERDLLATRANYFLAWTKEEKDTLKKRDSIKRRTIADYIKNTFGDSATQLASAIAGWDPYKPDRRAPYFDPESMFGLTTGFDIVIGNPPFVRADEQSDWNRAQREQILASAQYETLWEKWDLFVPFIERSYKLLKPGGVSALIVSDAFCHSKYAQKPQNWFLKHARILRLDFCGDLKIFDAAVHNIIPFFQKGDGTDNVPERRLHKKTFGNIVELPTDKQQNLTHRAFFPSEESATNEFVVPTLQLCDICYISVGMVVHADEKHYHGEFTTDELVQDFQDEMHSKPYCEGKHLDIWLPREIKWLEWGTERAPQHFRRLSFTELMESEKILVQRSPGPDPKCCFDASGIHFTDSSVGFVLWHSLSNIRNNSLKKVARYDGEKPPRPDLPCRETLEATSRRFAIKYLLGIMNSSVARDLLRANRRSNIHLYPDDWKRLPIPDVPAEKQAPVVTVVNLIITLTRYFIANPTEQSATDSVQIEFLENLNNALAKELFRPERLHEKKLFFGEFITMYFPHEIMDITSLSALDTIRKNLQTLTDIKHPLRAALYDLGSLELMEKEVARV